MDKLKATCIIKVLPSASQNALVEWRNNVLRVRLSASPEKGKANEALIRFLAKILGLSRQHIRIMRGEKNRCKLLAFEGLSQEYFSSLIIRNLAS